MTGDLVVTVGWLVGVQLSERKGRSLFFVP